MDDGWEPTVNACGLWSIRQLCIKMWNDSMKDFTTWAWEHFGNPSIYSPPLNPQSTRSLVYFSYEHCHLTTHSVYRKWTFQYWMLRFLPPPSSPPCRMHHVREASSRSWLGSAHYAANLYHELSSVSNCVSQVTQYIVDKVSWSCFRDLIWQIRRRSVLSSFS